MTIRKSGAPVALKNAGGDTDEKTLTFTLGKSSRTMAVQVYHRSSPPVGSASANLYRGISGSLQGYTDHIVSSSSSFLDADMSISKTLGNTNVGQTTSTYGYNAYIGYPEGGMFDTGTGGHSHWTPNPVIPAETSYNGPIAPGVYISGSNIGFGAISNMTSPSGESGSYGGGGTPGTGAYFPPIFTYLGTSYSICQLLWFKNTQVSGPFDVFAPYGGSSLTTSDNGNFLLLAMKKYTGGSGNTNDTGFNIQLFPKTFSVGGNSFEFDDATLDYTSTGFITFIWKLSNTQINALNALSGGISCYMSNPDRRNGIHEEFGPSSDLNNIKLSNYYKGGNNVINYTPVGGSMPTSGQIKISDFYDSKKHYYFDQVPMDLTSSTTDYQFHAYDSFIRSGDSVYSAIALTQLQVTCQLSNGGVTVRISKGNGQTLYVWESGAPGLNIGSGATRTISGTLSDSATLNNTANVISNTPSNTSYSATPDSVRNIKLKYNVHNSTVVNSSDFDTGNGLSVGSYFINAAYYNNADRWFDRWDYNYRNASAGIGVTFTMDAQAYSSGVVENNSCDIDFELWVSGDKGWENAGATTKIAEFRGRIQAYAEKLSSGGGGGGGSGGCFPAGALVTMSDGTKKRIETIEVGDMVKPHSEDNWDDGANEVLDFIEIESEERLIFTINAPGVSLEVTQGHPILTTDGWKAIDIHKAREIHPEMEINKLKVGNKLCLILLDEETGKYGPSEQVIESIIEDARDIPVYNLNVTGNDTYIVNDVAVHNK